MIVSVKTLAFFLGIFSLSQAQALLPGLRVAALARSAASDAEVDNPQIVLYTASDQLKRSDEDDGINGPQIVESESEKDSRRVPDYLYSNTIPMLNEQNVKYQVPQLTALPIAYGPPIITGSNRPSGNIISNNNNNNNVPYVVVPRVQLGFNVQGQSNVNWPSFNILPENSATQKEDTSGGAICVRGWTTRRTWTTWTTRSTWTSRAARTSRLYRRNWSTRQGWTSWSTWLLVEQCSELGSESPGSLVYAEQQQQ
ncbi:uncharacterized protein LOC133838864 [Drosophila sulfurigaster albostrigata]|uniref:uncharacterized protein LOC133838864 n=1 Tax=Drosophila sulfurigaster albostrigata TaxID=89887 RepID=UPI002D21C295|nr:uncharacterized protein LOC133838864 [Drosophila sulfurigaster albostrigata]